MSRFDGRRLVRHKFIINKWVMSAEDRLLDDYMALLSQLNTDQKLKLIARLTDSILAEKASVSGKEDESWRSLFGAWSDTEENLAEMIRANRLSNREIPSFD